MDAAPIQAGMSDDSIWIDTVWHGDRHVRDSFFDRQIERFAAERPKVHGVEIGRRIGEQMHDLTPLARAAFVTRQHLTTVAMLD